MDDPGFWLGVFATLVEALDPRKIALSIFARYIVSWLITFKVSRRMRRVHGTVNWANVITIILVGRFFIEFVVWVK